jgi:CHC2 zinc finger
MYSKRDYITVSRQVKAGVTIPLVWEKLYGAFPRKRSECRCPWREDKNASFSVSRDGQVWFDHGTGDKGDVFNFYMRATGCEARQAFLALLAMVQGSAPIIAPLVAPAEPQPQYHPPLRVPSSDELAAISRLRSISPDALRIAVARGFLWTAELKGNQAFVVTDKSRKCYAARKTNGGKWKDDAKVVLLPGSSAKWPIGCMEADKYPAVALCEGGPDFLAAFGHAWASNVEDQVAPVCMNSAALDIADEALPAFRGKRVRIFAHTDDAGMKASERWQAQLTGVASKVDCWRFGSNWMQTDGGPVKDLNDFLRIDYDCWEDDRTIIEGVMSF